MGRHGACLSGGVHCGCPVSNDALRVVMLGPGLAVRGGVSSVERVLLTHLPAQVQVTHIATMVEGSQGRKALTFARAALALWRSLNGPVDVVHLHFASRASNRRKMLLARLAMLRGARVVLHAHGGGYARHWQSMGSMERAFTCNTLQRAARLVVLGEDWREFFLSLGVAGHRIMVEPNPVVLPDALPPRSDVATVQLLYLGMITPRKGVFELLQAVAQLPVAVRSRLRLVMAGNGEVSRLREQAVQLGITDVVTIHDWVEQAQRDQLLAQSQGFILPSHTEGLPMALLEAMAWGLPVISTPVGSIAEHVSDGANGLLVPPGDVAALAGAMTRLVSDDEQRLQMGRLARASVQPLCARQYGERFAALYRTLRAYRRGERR